MNFFENQDQARQNTKTLLFLFVLAIVTIILSIYVVALFLLDLAPGIWWSPGLFALIAIVTSIAIGLASLYKISQLRAGGRVIAQELGGKLVQLETANTQERQLLNIVEEMAIAAGIAIPEVYLLDREPSINAFAAGFTINTAVIGVTRGCLQHLTRDELQGVIAHEFSHILNGDMGMNLRLIGLLNGILCIYIAGRLILDYTDDRDHRQFSCFALAIMLIGGIGWFFGRLIKAAVSRQREFLADASAVQFTRNPDGIAGVLEKLQQMDSRMLSPHAETASHMFFANGLKSSWAEAFSTHPSLAKRVQRIRGVATSSSPVTTNLSSTGDDCLIVGFAHGSEANTQKVTPKYSTQAQKLLAQIPESIRTNIREHYSAINIVYALALNSQKPEVYDRQITWLKEVQTTDVVEKVIALHQEINQLNPTLRLPLLDLVIPSLRQTTPHECQLLYKCVNGLVKAGEYFSLWEFVMQLVLWHRLQPYMHPELNPQVQFTLINEVWSDSLVLISAMARMGHTKPQAINYAFQAGVFRLPSLDSQEKPTDALNCTLIDIKKSIENLRLASPSIQQKVVDACAYTVLVDHQTSLKETILLRAIAILLDCPIPSFLNVYPPIPPQRSQ